MIDTLFMIALAALLMAGVAILIWLVAQMWTPTIQEFPPDPDLDEGDVSERARLTWAAHVAIQRLDAAVLMESPEDVAAKYHEASVPVFALAAHLKAERAANDA